MCKRSFVFCTGKRDWEHDEDRENHKEEMMDFLHHKKLIIKPRICKLYKAWTGLKVVRKVNKTNANENIRSHCIEILLSSGSPHVTVASRGYEEQDPFLLPPAIYYCLSESDQLRVPA